MFLKNFASNFRFLRFADSSSAEKRDYDVFFKSLSNTQLLRLRRQLLATAFRLQLIRHQRSLAV
jgi:hypothetical protein